MKSEREKYGIVRYIENINSRDGNEKPERKDV